MATRQEHLSDYFMTARFFYHHGLNQRLFYNLSLIRDNLRQLSDKELGEYYFLLGMAELRELKITDALKNLDKAHEAGLYRHYIEAVRKLIGNRGEIDIDSFLGKKLWFGHLNGRKNAEIVLERNGNITGSLHPNESSWVVEDNMLIFRNYRKERTSLFLPAKDGARLVGPFLNERVMHSLQVTNDEKA